MIALRISATVAEILFPAPRAQLAIPPLRRTSLSQRGPWQTVTSTVTIDNTRLYRLEYFNTCYLHCQAV
ncbi:MAG: hypothetical protein J5659_04015 [Clostridia bacterium]|nr:hypothetical protein [Clostridia bacterium]